MPSATQGSLASARSGGSRDPSKTQVLNAKVIVPSNCNLLPSKTRHPALATFCAHTLEQVFGRKSRPADVSLARASTGWETQLGVAVSAATVEELLRAWPDPRASASRVSRLASAQSRLDAWPLEGRAMVLARPRFTGSPEEVV